MVSCPIEKKGDDATAAKRAIIVVTFFMFLIYVAAVVLAYVKKEAEIGKRAKRFMNDVAYRDLFFFMFVSIAHIAVPKAFPTIMIWFYLIAYIVHGVLFFVNKPQFLFVTFIVKSFFVFLVIMTLLVDKWCDYFLYRGNKNFGSVDK